MLTLAISFVTWGVALFSFKIAFTGNPVYRLLFGTPLPVLKQAAACMNPEDPQQAEDDQIVEFLQRFSRITLITAFFFFAEIVLALIYVGVDQRNPFAWFLIGKTIISFIVELRLLKSSDRNPINAILGLPAWAIRWDRISRFVSALCLCALLFYLHGFI